MKKIVIIVLGAILLILGIRVIIPSKEIDVHALRQYCKNNGFDTEHCILVDFSRPSGVNRFYIYSFREDKIIHRSLCANGHGKEWNIFCRKFSNEPGSNYSSSSLANSTSMSFLTIKLACFSASSHFLYSTRRYR